MAYKLALPKGCEIDPVFHVSKLKQVVSVAYTPQEIPPTLTADWVVQPTIEDLMSLRYNNQGAAEMLIK